MNRFFLYDIDLLQEKVNEVTSLQIVISSKKKIPPEVSTIFFEILQGSERNLRILTTILGLKINKLMYC